MAKGHGTKLSIHNWLMFVICINKLALKIMEKNKMIVDNSIVNLRNNFLIFSYSVEYSDTCIWKCWKTVFTKTAIYLYVCPVCVDTITLYRIIGLGWNLAHLWKAQNERMSSLISLFWTMVLVLFRKEFSVKIKNSIFPSKYAIYGVTSGESGVAVVSGDSWCQNCGLRYWNRATQIAPG